jgi:hypothetical protein
MKKIIFALLLMLSTHAKADISATFARIECNKELEFLDIHYQNIRGDKIATHFINLKDTSLFYKTSEKTNTEIQLQNPASLSELRDSSPISRLRSSSYKYTCILNNNQEYLITLSLNPRNTCQQEAGYTVSIIQKIYKQRNNNQTLQSSKEIVKDIAIGCAEKYKRITITATSEVDAAISLKNYETKAYFPNFETNKTITDEIINQKEEEMNTPATEDY